MLKKGMRSSSSPPHYSLGQILKRKTRGTRLAVIWTGIRDGEAVMSEKVECLSTHYHPSYASFRSRLQISKNKRGRELGQTVLHLQSPTIRTTYIRCPMTTSEKYAVFSDLGITLPWLHIQVRPLGNGSGSGRDAWAFDIGIVDRSGKRGVIRASTFQVRSRLPNY